jgi:hypothetical protein
MYTILDDGAEIENWRFPVAEDFRFGEYPIKDTKFITLDLNLAVGRYDSSALRSV